MTYSQLDVDHKSFNWRLTSSREDLNSMMSAKGIPRKAGNGNAHDEV